MSFDLKIEAVAQALRRANNGSLIGMTEGDARICARAVLDAIGGNDHDEAMRMQAKLAAVHIETSRCAIFHEPYDTDRERRQADRIYREATGREW